MAKSPPLRRQLLLLAAIVVAVLLWRCVVIKALGITLYIDEAQYWTWAKHLDWGYFSKPPGIAALIAASTFVLGDSILGVKFLAMLCYPAAAGLAWAVARRLFDDECAFWSAFAVLTLPMFSWLGLFVSTDALLTLFWMAALLAYLGALERDRWQDWLLLGALCGLGLMSKYTMVIWMFAALLHLAIYHRPRLREVKPWAGAVLALAILSPNIIWNIVHDFPTLKHTADITVNKRANGGLGALSEFLAAQWIAFGPILGSIFIALLVTVRTTWRNERLRLLLWFSLPLWAIVSAQAFKTSANANWAAPAFAPAAIAVVAWLLQRGYRRLLAIALALNLLLVATIYHWPQLLSAAGQENARLDPYARARGWDEVGRQLTPLFAAHPGAVLVAENRTILAHLLYELRDLTPDHASWNPGRIPNDHYRLTTDLNRFRGRDLIFVTQAALPNVAPYVTASDRIAHIEAPINAERSLVADVYLLREFQGY
ncbi:MAG: glycosyltransferase family 39 protein [Betaproteobacteria bacterium]